MTINFDNLNSYFSQNYKNFDNLQTVCTDKFIIDMVNGIKVGKDIDLYLESRGNLAAIFDFFTGKSSNLNNLLGKNNHLVMESIIDTIDFLARTQRLSSLSLLITRQSLIKTTNALTKTIYKVNENEIKIKKLLNDFQDFTKQVAVMFENQNNRIDQNTLSIKVSNLILSWKPKKTGLYREFPFIIQVVLLTRHIASYYLIDFRTQTEVIAEITKSLTDSFLVDLEGYNYNPENHLLLHEFLDYSILSMLRKNKINFSVAEWLMEIRSTPVARLKRTPRLFIVGSALEFTKAQNLNEYDISLKSPSELAMALCSMNYERIDNYFNIERFITDLVQEVIMDCLYKFEEQESNLT